MSSIDWRAFKIAGLILLLIIGTVAAAGGALAIVWNRNEKAEAPALTAINDSAGFVHRRNLWGKTEIIWLSRHDGSGLSDDEFLAAIEPLTQLPDLRVLFVEYSDLTERGVASLPKLAGVEVLSLNNAKQITDAALAHLGRMPRLTQVRLFGTGVTAEGVHNLAVERPDIEVLHDHML